MRYVFSAQCSDDDFTPKDELEVRWDTFGEGKFSRWYPLDVGIAGNYEAYPGRTSLVMVAEVRDSFGQVDRAIVDVDRPHGRHPTPDLIASGAFVQDGSGQETTIVVAGETFTVGIRYYGWGQTPFQWNFEVEYLCRSQFFLTQAATADGHSDAYSGGCEVDTAEFAIEEPGEYFVTVSLGQPAEIEEYSWYNNSASLYLTVVAP